MGRTRQAEAVILNLKEKQETSQKIKNKFKVTPIFLALIIILGCFLFFLIISKLNFTGFFIGSQEQETQKFSQNLGIITNQSVEYQLKLENAGQLKSVKINGLIQGEGEVKIYINEFLILDSSKIKTRSESEISSITGNIIEGNETEEKNETIQETEYNESYSEQEAPLQEESSPSHEESLTENKTSEENKINITKQTEYNESYSEQEAPLQEESSPSHEESLTENKTSEENNSIKEFSDFCEETCDLEKLNLTNSSYTLKIEIYNSSLKLNTIDYEIFKTEIQNISQFTENITEETINLSEDVINTIQYEAVLGQPVKWKKQIFLKEKGPIKIEIPKDAQNIIVNKINSQTNITKQTEYNESYSEQEAPLQEESSPSHEESLTEKEKIKEKANSKIEKKIKKEENKEYLEISIEENTTNYEIEYETPAPYSTEEKTTRGKKIKITGPEDIHYEEVLVFTNLSESLNIKSISKIKIYWLEQDSYLPIEKIEDTDNNGIYDYIEWIVPHLSNQTFEIIIITKAEHLDSNRTFISDIYEEVKSLDNIWSETINDSDYVRVTFEIPLDNTKDITLYPIIISGNPKIEIYEINETEKIAEFTSISSNEYNKVYLTNLEGSQDTFDLRIIEGEVKFDYILDPTGPPTITFEFPTPSNNSATNNPVTILTNISDESNTSSWMDFDRSLMAYWAMDYANSTHVFDNSSYKLYNASFQNGIGVGDKVTGIRGDALHFDGGNNYLRMEISSTYNKTTYSYWMNNDFEIVDIGSSSYEPAFSYSTGNDYGMYFGADDRYIGNFWSTTSGQHYVNWWPSTINESEWHYFTHVIDSDVGYVALYVDGIFAGNDTDTPWTPSTKSLFMMGRYLSNYYNGSIDEFMIFNRTLNAQEVKALYSSQINKFNATFNSLGEGQHNYTIYTIDELGNTNNSGERNFIITSNDVTFPAITFESPTPNNSSTTNALVTILANISDASNTSSWIDFDKKLLGYWSMDYYNYTHIFDNSSYKNNGSFNGGLNYTNLTTGIRGDALDFDGIDDHINMGTSFGNTGTNDFTLTGWINPDLINESYKGIAGKWHTTEEMYYVRISSDNKLAGVINFGTTNIDTIGNSALVAGNYYHFAYVVNRTGNTSLYVNGILQTDTKNISGNYSVTINNPASFAIGRIGNALSGWNWNGSIDEIMLFNKTLSQTEVKALYSSQINKFNTTFNNLGEGQHNYTIYAIDEYGNLGTSEERNFIVYINTNAPEITWENPTPTNGETITNKFVYLNTTINGYNNFSAWFDWNKSLAGYWGFDYYNSTAIYDNSSYNSNGTFQGTLSTNNITTGPRGKGLNFDGDDYVLIGQPGQLNIDPDDWNYSILVWCKVSPGQEGYFISKAEATTTNRQYGIYIQYDVIGTYLGGIGGLTSINISDNNWHQIALTVNSNTNGTLYIDGKVRNSSIQKGSSTNANDVIIGGRRNIGNTGFGFLLTGSLDEVIIFNRTLSSEEINATYNASFYRLYNNFTDLKYGIYNYSAYAIDEEGNINIVSPDRQITLYERDITPPTITFEEPPTPENASSTTNPVTIVANISDDSSGNTSAWIDFNRSLLSYWSMDYYNATGIYDNSSWNDNFANFNNGLNYSNLTKGARGQGLIFDGTDDYLSAPSSKFLPIIGKQYTISVWINDNTSAATLGSLFHRIISFADGTINIQLGLANTGGAVNNRTFYIQESGSTDIKQHTSGNVSNAWHHVVATSNGSSWNMYLDGALSNGGTTISSGSTSYTTNTGLIYIGQRGNGGYINGSIDEAMIFNRTLSETEIKALYDSKSNKFNATFTNLADGQHNYTIYTIDEAGNGNNSGERNFIVEEQIVGENACGTLNLAGQTYTLTDNISSTGTCFTVTEQNITIDCNNNWIIYSTDGINNGHGIYTTQYNTTIKNCNILDGNMSSNNEWRLGIYFNSANYSTVFNNSVIAHNSSSIYFYTVKYLNLTKNTARSNEQEGLSGHYVFNSSIINNTGITLSERGDAFGILLQYTYNSTIFRNNGTSRYRGTLFNYADNNNITNNLGEGGNQTNGAGLMLSHSSNNTVINNTGIANENGIYLWAYSENNTLINNTGMSKANSSGLVIYTSSGNIVINQNSTGLGTEGDSIKILESNNTIIKDCIYLSSLNWNMQNNYASVNNTIINCSYDIGQEYVADISQLIRKWYYQAYVNYTNGTPVLGANISAYNTTGHLQFTTLTNSSGYINKQEITEYINRAGTKSYYNNYTINANLSGYINDSNILNITSTQNKLNDWFTLEEGLIPGENICGTLDTPGKTYTLESDVNSTGTCFTIEAENIILDCNGHWITYSTAGGANTFGIITDQFNTTLKNCNIIDGNWTSTQTTRYGIYLNVTSDNSTLYNNTVNVSNSNAIYIYNGANFNNLTNNNATSNLGIGIHIHLSSNNTLISNTGTSTESNGISIYSSSSNSLTSNTGTSLGNITAGAAIYMYNSLNNTLTNNLGKGFLGNAIFLELSSNNTLTHNTGTSISSNGIYLNGASNNTLISNTGTGIYGISLASSSTSNTLRNNKGISNTSFGIEIESSSNNNLTSNNGTSNSGVAIYIVDVSNLTLTNNTATSTENNGIHLYSVSNSTLTNNTATSFGGNNGILLQSSSNNSLINNTGTSISSHGIYLRSSSNNNVLINNTGTSLGSGYGIYLDSSSNNNLTNNAGTSLGSGYGIYLVWSSENNTLTNNKATSNSSYAIYVYQSNNLTLTNNTVISTSGVAMNFYNSSNNVLTNNLGKSDSNSGIYLFLSSNSTLTNNTAITSGMTSALSFRSSLNNTIINQIAISNGTVGIERSAIYIEDANNTIFRDCINITGALYDVYYNSNAGSINNTFINCSYALTNVSKEYVQGAGNELIRKWYYQAYANYSNGVAASDANISAYNTTGHLQFTTSTNSSGWIDRQEITEYINTAGTRSFYNNYTINARKTGYLDAINIFNFTTQKNKVNNFFTLNADITPPTITFQSPTPANGSLTTNPVTIVANISDSSNVSSWMDLDRSLIGYWAMDYYNYTHIFDNSSYKNNGSFNGGLNYTNLTTGARGQGLIFDGVDDRIITANNLSLTMTDKISVSFWIKFNSTRLEIIGEHSANFNSNNAFLIDAGESGGPGQISLADHSSSGYNVVYTSNSYNDGNWHHFVGIINRSAGLSEMTIYIDGINDTLQHPIHTWDNNGNFGNYPFYIGGRNTSSNNFTGSLDEVMIFNRTISETEILALYNSKPNKFNATFTNLENGQHNYTVYAIDEYGNVNNSGNRNLIVESPIPVIYNVSYLSPITLTEGPSPTFIIVNFSVYDANGASNLNSSTAAINFTKSGEELRKNSSCELKESSGNYANYTCNVTMWWFDSAGNDWKIYANISDIDSNTAINSTRNFTVNSLKGFVMHPSSLNFAALVAGSKNQTPINHLILNNTGNEDISLGNIEINATDLVGESDSSKFLYAGNFSASPYTGNKIECNISSSATATNNYTFTKIANTVLQSGNYTINDGTGQEEVYLCLRETGIELTHQQYSTKSFGSWTIRIVLVALSVRKRRKKEKENSREITIPLTIFSKKLGALEATSKYLKENLGMSYHNIGNLLNRNERTIWTAYNKSIEKQKERIEVKETDIFIPLSELNNRESTILKSLIAYLRNKNMRYSEIAKLINRNQKNIRSIYIEISNKLKKNKKTKQETKITIPLTIFSKKLGALEATSKYLKENLGMSYHNIGNLLNRDERTIWTAYNKSLEKQKERIEVKETDIFIPLSELNNRESTILKSLIAYLRNKNMRYSEIAKLINRNQKNIRAIYNTKEK